MFTALLKPHVNLASAALRLTMAAIALLHGYINLTMGRSGTWMEELNEFTVGLVACCEVAGGVALLVGLLSRLAALGLGIIQVGAVLLVTGEDFFIVEFLPSGNARLLAGSEFNVVLIAMCLAIVLLGSGKLSLDHLIWGRGKKEKPQGS